MLRPIIGRTNFTMSMIPTILSIGGAFLLQMKIITAILLYVSGLFIGVGNAIRPLLTQQKEHAANSHIADE